MISLGKVWFYILLFVLYSNLISSERYWVYFTDKGKKQNLSKDNQLKILQSNLTERAMARRERRGLGQSSLELFQKDLPIEETYLEVIEQMGFNTHGISKWFNGISGYAAPEILNEIEKLPFVISVEKVHRWVYKKQDFEEGLPGSFNKLQVPDSILLDYGPSSFQIQFHNINELHRKGLNGDGVIIGVFDTGFNLNHPALEHINSQVVGEFDFIQNDTITSNQTGDATQQDIHGTQVLSVLGGYMPGSLVGPAFGANFLLAKTEKIDEEIHQEEDNWAMAAEWAEGLGVDIISSSLGYSIFDPQQTDYSYSDMDGETTIITRAANELALRGVIVVSGAGNEGNSDWHFITAPADGFYVLAVGALDHDNNITSFSSRGPSSDQRIKPDVSGLGSQVYTVKPDSNFGYYNGTSLSCPLVGGICAQILQANSELNLLQMNDIIKNSGDTAGNPDNERGWGKVDALAAWNLATGLTNGGAYQKPLTVKFHSPRPNPISKGRGFIFFPIELPEPAVITLNIYNILGQKVFQSEYNGTNTQNLLSWNLHNFFGEIVPAGMYFYRIQIESKLLLGKFIIVN